METKSDQAEVATAGDDAAGGPAAAERYRVPSMDMFYDVNVSVWAELGRTDIPIRELLQLGEGAVLRLNRPVFGPVDLIAQGVRIARGKVVVVDDSFAIRITELESDAQATHAVMRPRSATSTE